MPQSARTRWMSTSSTGGIVGSSSRGYPHTMVSECVHYGTDTPPPWSSSRVGTMDVDIVTRWFFLSSVSPVSRARVVEKVVWTPCAKTDRRTDARGPDESPNRCRGKGRHSVARARRSIARASRPTDARVRLSHSFSLCVFPPTVRRDDDEDDAGDDDGARKSPPPTRDGVQTASMVVSRRRRPRVRRARRAR